MKANMFIPRASSYPVVLIVLSVLAAALACTSTDAPAAAPTATVVPADAPAAAPTATVVPADTPTPVPTATAVPADTPTPAPTATQAEPAAAPDDLPPAVWILPPEYHRAYRLLPTEGPWTRRYIAGFFDDFDYEEWQQLPWEDEVQGEYQPTLHDQQEVTQIIPMLRVAERDPEAEAWLLAKVAAFAPEAAEQLQSAQDVSARVEVFRKLVEVDGHEWDVEALSLEWGGREAGLDEDFIARIIERQRAHYEYVTDPSFSWKQNLLDGNKGAVCSLLLDLVLGGEYPPSVVIGLPIWCDIDMAIELAEEALLANGGQPAVSEDDIREWMEADAQ